MGKELHMMIGGTGTGKSTLSKELNEKHGYKIFSPDEIEIENSHLEGKDIDNLIDNDLNEIISTSESFILDGKCLTSEERLKIIDEAKAHGYTVYGYDFGGGNLKSQKRRLNNPREMPKRHWDDVFKFDKNNYAIPEIEEGFKKIYNHKNLISYIHFICWNLKFGKMKI